jgi:hypothetical protein
MADKKTPAGADANAPAQTTAPAVSSAGVISASAPEKAPAVPETSPAPIPQSEYEDIPSRCIKRFYTKAGALVREGSTFVFSDRDWDVYPWPLLRPIDTSLNETLKEEYNEARKAKLQKVSEKANVRTLLAKM